MFGILYINAYNCLNILEDMKRLEKLEKVAKGLADIKEKSGIPNPILAKKMYPQLDEKAALAKFNYIVYGGGKLGYEEVYLLAKALESIAREIIEGVQSYLDAAQRSERRKEFILRNLDKLAENEEVDKLMPLFGQGQDNNYSGDKV